MKVGDPVIVYKSIWYQTKSKRSGIISKIIDCNKIYQIKFYDINNRWVDGCNIFIEHGDTIELDILKIRDIKLNKLV
jgi:hypothetical protein